MDSLLNENGLTDEDCCVEISDYHLKKISNSVCKDWRSMPSYLEMEEIVVSDIEHDCKDLEERVKRHKFLSTWKSEKGSAVTYKKLMEALLEIKCKSEAEKVCKIVRQLSNTQEDPINAEDTNTAPAGTLMPALSEASIDPRSPVYRDLKTVLETNIRKIHTQYAFYVSTIRNNLKAKIDCKELRTHLRNIPVFLKNEDTSNKMALLSYKADELQKASSIDEIFDILSTECCSFLDFDLYESLITFYKLDTSHEHLNYKTHVREYLNGHKVTEFVMINPGLLVRSDILDKLSFKFDIEATCKLAKIKELKTAIAKILGLHESGLQLFDISEGCVGVTFLISKPVSQQLFFSSETVLTSECIRELQKLSVLWMKLNDNTLFDVTKSNQESQQSQIPLSEERKRSKSVTAAMETGFRRRSYNITDRKKTHSVKENARSTKDTDSQLEEVRKQLVEHLSRKENEPTGNQQLLPPDPDTRTESEIPSTRSSLNLPKKSLTPPDPDSGTGSEVPSNRSSQLEPDSPSKRFSSAADLEPDSGTSSEAPSNRSSRQIVYATSSPLSTRSPLATASTAWHAPDSPNQYRTNAPSTQQLPKSRSKVVPLQHSTKPGIPSVIVTHSTDVTTAPDSPSQSRSETSVPDQTKIVPASLSPSPSPSPSTSPSPSHNVTSQDNLVRDIIQRKMETFLKSTNFNALKSHFPSDFLPTNTMKHLEALTSDKIRNEQFYMIFLPKKEPGAYNKLFECLKSEQEHSGHKDLVEIIEKELKENTS